MKLEEIKEGQYLYYTERNIGVFRGGSPDHADSLFRIYRSGETLRAQRLCHNWDGNYKNIEEWDPFYDAIFVASGFDERRWFLTDFPGGDAAEWMSRNYPLNGQAVKEEPQQASLAPWKTIDSAPMDGTPFVWLHYVTVLSSPVEYKPYAEVIRRCWMGKEKKGSGFWMGQSISRSDDELSYGWWMPLAPTPDENQD